MPTPSLLETSIDEATNGNEAIESQTADPFDLIITDLLMPEKQGVEAIIELKRDYPDLKIIAISGGGQIKNPDCIMLALELADEFGADRVLAKPFSDDELLEHVNDCLS